MPPGIFHRDSNSRDALAFHCHGNSGRKIELRRTRREHHDSSSSTSSLSLKNFYPFFLSLSLHSSIYLSPFPSHDVVSKKSTTREISILSPSERGHVAASNEGSWEDSTLSTDRINNAWVGRFTLFGVGRFAGRRVAWLRVKETASGAW